MSNQTLPESSKKAKTTPTRKTPPAHQAKGRLYRRQTARVEERRDGKPLFFKWGARLSRRQKTKIQTRTFWAFVTMAILAVVGVLAYSFYYVNYLVPAEPVVTVDGHTVPQSLFRQMNFYLAQDLSNQLASVQHQQAAAQILASSSDAKKKAQGQQELSSLQTQQQTLNAELNIPQVGSESVNYLEDDIFIQQQIPVLEAQGVPASKLEASDKDITTKLNAFKKALAPGVTYSQFLSSSKMSEEDFRQILAVLIRHDKMDQYQQSLFGPTAPQVHASLLQLTTQQNADKYLAQLQSASDVPGTFEKLAKRYSRDVNSKDKGGDLGWLVYGDLGNAGGALAERWLFDPARKVGDLSPVIKIVSDQYDIFYISAIDPHRPISAGELSALKSGALDHWIAQQKVLPQTTITDVDSAKQVDPNNFPPSLPAGASTGGGVPGMPGSGGIGGP
jgi:hypothetical protein